MSLPDTVLNLPSETRMLDVVRHGLASAEEACFAVAFTRFSGFGLLVDPLMEFVGRGGRARLLTSTYQAITQPAALRALRALPGVEARVQDGPTAFHAKFWWFSRAHGGLSDQLCQDVRPRTDPRDGSDAGACQGWARRLERGRAGFGRAWPRRVARPPRPPSGRRLLERRRELPERGLNLRARAAEEALSSAHRDPIGVRGAPSEDLVTEPRVLPHDER